jgi:hypothetical protein
MGKEVIHTNYEVVDSDLARERADLLRPSCTAWLRRAKKLFREMPPGTRIYFEGDQGMCLMALAEDGRTFVRSNNGEDQAAVIATIPVRGDCGGW